MPGVGKSTFIDALGIHLTGEGHRVAVLAVDPSSTRTGGSILGDKTRMARLARPTRTPSSGRRRPPARSAASPGATRETMVVMEAAGYDVVLVETVGVGQSETAVAEMVDTFLLLTLARTGDQLQGIKKGVLELADVIAVNKADGPHEMDARKAARELAGALRLLRAGGDWTTPVLTCSGQEGERPGRGLAADRPTTRTGWTASGELAAKRRRQQVDWTWALVRDRLLSELKQDPEVAAITARVEREVLDGTLTPALAADRLLAAFTRPRP